MGCSTKKVTDRALVPDDEAARPLECLYRNRSIQVQTLFGVLTLKRNYYYHIMDETGRCPLDQALDLLRGGTPGVVRLICRAAAISSSYDAAAADRLAYGGLEWCGRNFGRFAAEATPSLLQAQAGQTPSQGGPIDIMYVSEDGTGCHYAVLNSWESKAISPMAPPTSAKPSWAAFLPRPEPIRKGGAIARS